MTLWTQSKFKIKGQNGNNDKKKLKWNRLTWKLWPLWLSMCWRRSERKHPHTLQMPLRTIGESEIGSEGRQNVVIIPASERSCGHKVNYCRILGDLDRHHRRRFDCKCRWRIQADTAGDWQSNRSVLDRLSLIQAPEISPATNEKQIEMRPFIRIYGLNRSK